MVSLSCSSCSTLRLSSNGKQMTRAQYKCSINLWIALSTRDPKCKSKLSRVLAFFLETDTSKRFPIWQDFLRSLYPQCLINRSKRRQALATELFWCSISYLLDCKSCQLHCAVRCQTRLLPLQLALRMHQSKHMLTWLWKCSMLLADLPRVVITWSILLDSFSMALKYSLKLKTALQRDKNKELFPICKLPLRS